MRVMYAKVINTSPSEHGCIRKPGLSVFAFYFLTTGMELVNSDLNLKFIAD